MKTKNPNTENELRILNNRQEAIKQMKIRGMKDYVIRNVLVGFTLLARPKERPLSREEQKILQKCWKIKARDQKNTTEQENK